MLARYARATKRWSQVGFVAAALALAGVFVYLQVARAGEPLALDQGLFACFGREVARGALPYRDIFDSKPPLFLYTWVLAWAPGRSAGSVWAFEAIWLAATMGLAFAIGRRLRDRWAGLAAAAFLFLGLWSPGFGGYWSRFQAEEALALPALGALWLALSAIERERRAIWVGVLTAAVGLYKIPGMAAAGAWAALWLVTLPRRDALRRIGWMAGGLIAPWLVAIVWFAAHGALGDFYQAVFVYQRHLVEVIAPPWSRLPGDFARTLGRELSPLLVGAGAGLVLLWRGDRGRAGMLATWIGATAAAILLQRQLAGYHYLLVVPPLALAAAVGVSGLAAEMFAAPKLGRAAAVAALLVIVVLAATRVPAWGRLYGRGMSYQTGSMSRATYLRGFEAGLFSPAAEAEVARYIAARTDPDDGILVWGLSPGIYALADRHPTTRFPFHKLLLTDAPLSRRFAGLDERQADFLRRLQVDPPAYIVLGTNDRNPFEPLDSVRGMIAFPGFEAIARGYRHETRIGRFVLLARPR